jgi:hypothetical protein
MWSYFITLLLIDLYIVLPSHLQRTGLLCAANLLVCICNAYASSSYCEVLVFEPCISRVPSILINILTRHFSAVF